MDLFLFFEGFAFYGFSSYDFCVTEMTLYFPFLYFQLGLLVKQEIFSLLDKLASL